MKKKLVYGIIIALTGITFINVSLSLDSEKLSATALFAAVEAIASGEILPPVDVTCDTKGWGRCYEPIVYGPLPHPYFQCTWTGSPSNYCLEPI